MTQFTALPLPEERRLDVVLTHPYVWPEVRRGAERYLRQLSRYLLARGHRARVLSTAEGDRPRHDPAVPHRFRPRTAQRALTRRGADPLAAFLPTMAVGLARERAPLVHALSPADGAAAVLTRPRAAVVTTLTGIPFRWWNERRGDTAALWRVLLSGADAVVCLSSFAARVLAVDYGRVAHVVPPGVDTATFAPRGARRDPPTVLFVGALDEPRKRVELLVQAFARSSPDLRLVVTGPGDPRRALAARDALPPSARRRVEIRDVETEQLPSLYSEAAVTVLPSRNEAFGLTLAESLACGTPVVGTDDAGITDVIDDDRIGRRFAPDDPDDLAGAIEEAAQLAGDPRTRERCRRSAMRFDWDTRIGPRIERLYAEALSR